MTVNAGMNAAGPDYDSYETPRPLFAALDAIFHFTVDAAASPRNALLTRYWSPAVSGLVADWAGERVFVNPPYSDIGAWTRRAATGRDYEQVVMLLPSFTGSEWFHRDVLPTASGVWFLRKRVRFTVNGRPPLNPRTGAPSGPRFASIVVTWQPSAHVIRVRGWDWEPAP